MGDSAPIRNRLADRLKEALVEYHSRLEPGEEIDIQQLLADMSGVADKLLTPAEHADKPHEPKTLDYTPDQQETAKQSLDRTMDFAIDRQAAASTNLPTSQENAVLDLRLPDYEILSEIARGGMGVVFRAKQISLNRTVAVKTILAGQLASVGEIDRFRAEAEAAANLHHRNIVAIYEVGRAGNRQDLHFFSMEYIEGPSLTQLVRENPLATKHAASYVEKIARAIDYAHRQGVLHRDLKPSNILIDRDDEPKITDFGLSKRIEADSNLTMSGTILGTPSYMPPEQASGNTNEVGPSSDIYSIGAILYELLTGRPPFRAETATDTLLQVLTEEPLSPIRLQPKIPRDLDTICLKCLQKDPRRRYASALELAEDLQRHLRDEPIHARPISIVERAVKWTRRRPAWASLIAVTVLGLATLIAGGIWYSAQLQNAFKKENTQRTLAEKRGDKLKLALTDVQTERDLSKERLKEVRRNYYAVQIQKAHEFWKSPKTEIDRAIQLLNSQRPKQNEADMRGFEWHHLWYRCFSDEATLGKLGSSIYLLRYLPNGDLVVGQRADYDEFIEVYRGTRRLRRFSLKSPAAAVPAIMDISPQGTRLAIGWNNGQVIVYDFVKPDKPLCTISADKSNILALTLSPDGKFLASAGSDKKLKLWNVANAELISTFEEHTASINAIAFSPDGTLLASSSNDFTSRLYDVHTKSLKHTLTGHKNAVTALAFSPDGERLASVGADGAMFIWQIRDGKSLGRFYSNLWGGLWAAAYSPDGKRIAIGGVATNVFVFDLSKNSYHSAKGHREFIKHLAFAPDSKRLASGSQDGFVKLWNPDRHDQRCAEIRKSDMPVLKSVCYSRDGKLLAIGGGDLEDPPGGNILIVNATTQQIKHTLRSKHLITNCDFSPDGKTLLTCTANTLEEDVPGNVQLWNVELGKPCGTVNIDGIRIFKAAFIEANTMALACDDGKIRIWDLHQSAVKYTLDGHEGNIDQLTLSSIAQILISRGDDLDIRLWNLATRQTIAISHGHILTGKLTVAKNGRFAAWTMPYPTHNVPGKPKRASLIKYPNGHQNHEDKFVAVYDFSSRRVVHVLGGNAAHVGCLAFSPSGDRLAIGSADGIVRIWDTATGHELLDVTAHSRGVISMAFSPDGTQLASVGIDGTVRIWLTSGN